MENILLQKANYLSDILGYDVTIITTDQDGRETFFKKSTKIKQIDLGINYYKYKSSLFWHIKKYHLIRQHRKKLTSILRDSQFDICISLMDFDFTFLPLIKDNSKKIAEFHFSRYSKALSSTNKLKKLVQYLRTYLWKYYLNKYNQFVVLTEQDKQQWGNMANIKVIPNFINETHSGPYNELSKQIISVGRADYQKGYDMLLSAWEIAQKELPGWELVIFGGGDKSDLKSQIHNKKIANLKLCPPTPNIGEEYLKSSLYVMSSRYEGLPLVLLEAMCYGLPIVSFECPCGPRDILRQNFGRLVKSNSIQDLAEALIDCVEDFEWRKEASYAAKERSKLYLKERIMTIWQNLFNELTNNKNND